MTLFHCGCGLGAITIGLAELDQPISITGLDIGEDRIDCARGLASEKGMANMHFETGSVYDTPFPDKSFDGGFAN